MNELTCWPEHKTGKWIVSRTQNGTGNEIVFAECYTQANADLCLAAQGMLEALEECITNEGANCLAYGADTPTLRRRLEAISNTARKALAKAKGE